MNPNPYPHGRWTPAASVDNPAPVTERIPNGFLDFDLRSARLSELFWTPPESEIFVEAVQRLDSFLHLAMDAAPAPVEASAA
jgi:hypothetical protein